jgi:hypothetical protein
MPVAAACSYIDSLTGYAARDRDCDAAAFLVRLRMVIL